MAFKPSHRRSRPSYILDLNIAPLLSLFVALIPMLLLTAMFQKVGIVNLYLPTLEEALLQENTGGTSKDFTLAVSVTLNRLTLLKDQEVLLAEDIGDGLALDMLAEELAALKDRFPDKRDAVLLLDGEILYETIIDVMDAMRIAGDRELFPEISLADRVREVN
ncbi:MAG: biopolymer transporter ExbD [bacterium]|nr:MAG: biopolymer transporter ExbD [bacterium]